MRLLAGTATGGLLAIASSTSHAATYDSLPAPMASFSPKLEYVLYLGLSVNGNTLAGTVPVKVSNDRYWVSASVLRQAYIPLPEGEALVDVSQIPSVQFEYDQAGQMLKLKVPDSWLPEQRIDNTGEQNYHRPLSTPGLLFNYDSYSLVSSDNSKTTSTSTETRFFGAAGTFSNFAVIRQNWSSGNAEQQGYIRYDTLWKYSDTERMLSYQAGDVVSDALTWSSSVRLGGLRFSRNFSVRPDLVTYPLLNLSGSAEVPSSVDLFINGYKASSTQINGGPYTLTNVPYISGAGEATVVTTDALGRQVTTSVPFYVSNTLLREGLSDFDFSIGALRNNYGIKNADYGAGAVSAIYRYGVSNWLTLSTHTENREGLANAGIGSDISVGTLGTLSLSASASQGEGNGNQLTSGYSYYSGIWGLNYQHIQRSADFDNLSSYRSTSTLSRQSDQATLSFSPWGRVLGSFSLGYFDIQAQDSSRTRLMNLSWSRGLWKNSSVNISVNHDLQANSYSSMLQLIIPFDELGSVQISGQRSSSGEWGQNIAYNRSAPVEGGLGWNLAHSISGDNYSQADLTWVNKLATLSGGYYGSRDDRHGWFEAAGSVVLMDNSLFFARRINDAFIVVSTDGYPDVTVNYENRKVGATDKNGHLLIPWATAWYPGKVTLDTLPLPTDTEVPMVEQRIAVRESSGALVEFPVRRVRSATITLVDGAGQPLALGTPVEETTSHQVSVVGYDGIVWLSHLNRENKLVINADKGQCVVHFKLPEQTPVPQRVGPISCQ
ncbi:MULTISPECIES: fimbria/pilus outer membrane usher protein [Enterobacteriaceae]|uniref:fimbria/pilus outer membrane usher protein n=1 Tax=Enterobacteriaceae TaxID=543 RepID=UPI000F4C7E40|nr:MULTISPECIES: fimbria/pilus outer membrane usher protein [Enterobacteriaceae]MRT50676.1 fimbria/pilus outer membrane usher protein [Raoultella sp. RIT712]QNK08429.1 fimbrial biogenesis outer membrane usher protein [Enterobacter sp. JUb54]ROS16364.1 outer membrane usher protein [Raoultella sp. BIGb0399]